MDDFIVTVKLPEGRRVDLQIRVGMREFAHATPDMSRPLRLDFAKKILLFFHRSSRITRTLRTRLLIAPDPKVRVIVDSATDLSNKLLVCPARAHGRRGRAVLSAAPGWSA